MARPKRVWTDEQKQLIDEYARNNCHIDTIALALGVPKESLVRSFGTIISQKRAQGRIELRQAQRKQINTPAMAIFLGKNELNQSDKQDINHSGEIQLTAPAIA